MARSDLLDVQVTGDDMTKSTDPVSDAEKALQADAALRQRQFVQGLGELEQRTGFTLSFAMILTAQGIQPNIQAVPIPDWKRRQ